MAFFNFTSVSVIYTSFKAVISRNREVQNIGIEFKKEILYDTYLREIFAIS